MENNRNNEKKLNQIRDVYTPKTPQEEIKSHAEDLALEWHEDGMKFETLREAHEWAYSVIYNEIGNLYEGYKTTDEKIAYSLVYELIRANTLYGNRFNVNADHEDSGPHSIIYKVWVTPIDKK